MPNDFISREVFAEYLCDEIATSMADGANEAAIALIETLVKLRAIPPADVVEVVRCKDCRFYAIKQSSLCDTHNTSVNAEDYCSYGTKMDGGEHHAD